MFRPSGVPVYLTYRAYRRFAGRLEDEHRHREVIESLNEGMAVVHADGQIGLWNDALERIMGISRDQALGRSLVEAVPSWRRQPLPKAVTTVLETGQADTSSTSRSAVHRPPDPPGAALSVRQRA